MKYKIQVWIPVEVEPEDETIYDSYDEAYEDMKNIAFMQPENRYEIEEIEE